jgi:hypothetical protein
MSVQEVKCNLWARRAVDRTRILFEDASINTDQVFLEQMQHRDAEQNLTPGQRSANMTLRMSMWGLVRIHDTEHPAVRKHYLRFLEHLENAELSLQRALDIHQRNPPVPARPHQPEVLSDFPTSTGQ